MKNLRVIALVALFLLFSQQPSQAKIKKSTIKKGAVVAVSAITLPLRGALWVIGGTCRFIGEGAHVLQTKMDEELLDYYESIEEEEATLREVFDLENT